jgi:hypothetical protein
MFSFEERICRNGQTSVSAPVGQMQGRTRRASNDRLACGAGGFRDDLNAPSLERYFRALNAPYFLNDPGNHLKSQQMRPPSERTKQVNYLQHSTLRIRTGGQPGVFSPSRRLA